MKPTLVLASSAPSTLDAPELPQCYQKAWTACERQPIPSKRWAEIQCLLPKTWGKHKPKSVHSKNLSCPFATAWNLCPCSMKWPWSRVSRESRSVLTLLHLKAQHFQKGQYLFKNCSPSNTQHGVNPTQQNHIFCFLTLLGLLTIFTLWRRLETFTSLRIYGMGHYMLWYRYSFCFSHTVTITTTTHLEFKWQ